MSFRLLGTEETRSTPALCTIQIPTQVHVSFWLWVWITEMNQHLHNFVAHLFLCIQVLFI